MTDDWNAITCLIEVYWSCLLGCIQHWFTTVGNSFAEIFFKKYLVLKEHWNYRLSNSIIFPI